MSQTLRREGPPVAKPNTRTIVPAEPCRFCGQRTYLADDVGPLHPCCAFWMGELGNGWCEACRIAKAPGRK